MFFFSAYRHPRELHVRTHSSPTRRFSDLAGALLELPSGRGITSRTWHRMTSPTVSAARSVQMLMLDICAAGLTARRQDGHARSEEHTSALQSLMRNSYAVFCLKKKTQT